MACSNWCKSCKCKLPYTCKIPFKTRFGLYLSNQSTDSKSKNTVGKLIKFSFHKAIFIVQLEKSSMSTIKILTVFPPKLSFMSSEVGGVPSQIIFLYSLSTGIIRIEIRGDENFSFLMIVINY